MATSIIAVNPQTVATFRSGSSISLTGTNQNITLALSTESSNSGYTASGGGIVIPTTGKYLISGVWGYDSLGASSNTLTAALMKNTSGTTTQLDAIGITHTGTYYTIVSPPRLYALTAGDIIYAASRNNTSSVGKCGASVTIQHVE